MQALNSAAALARSLDHGPDAILDLRNEAIACASRDDLDLERHWEGYPLGSKGLAFDADFERYARRDDRGRLLIYKVDDGREVMRLPAVDGLQSAPGIQFSPDNRYLASYRGWPGGPCAVWDLHRQKVLLRLPRAIGLDFSPDSRRVAIARGDDSIRLYDLATGRPGIQISPGLRSASIHSFRFSPRGDRLAIASDSETNPQAQIWDLTSGKLIQQLPNPAAVTALAWHPGGRYLATGSDQRICIWDLDSGQPQALLEGTKARVVQLAYSPDGHFLASGGWDNVLRLWDPVTGRELFEMPATAELVFSRDGGRMSYRNGSRVGILRVAVSQACRTLQGDSQGLKGLDISPDGGLLASGGVDGVRFWDPITGKLVGSLPIPMTHAVMFDPQGNQLFTSSDAGLHRWPLTAPLTHANCWQIGPPQPFLVPPGGNVDYSALSGDGRTLVVVRYERNRADVYDVPSRTVRSELKDHAGLWCPAVSPDGKWAATGTWHGAEIRIWDAGTGKAIKRLPYGSTACSRVAFSPDGKWLVTGMESAYCLYKVGSWQPGPRIARDGAANLAGLVAFTQDSRLMAVSHSNDVIKLVDPATGREFATLPAARPSLISWICFSPDGSRLAVGAEKGLIHLWDLRHLRGVLAELGLDWELPPFPPPNGSPHSQPPQVQIDLGKLR
jgi:WD40 repeat protein